MKILVSAFDAQLGLVLEVKGVGAARKGMRELTPHPWRLRGEIPGENLHLVGSWVQCSLP